MLLKIKYLAYIFGKEIPYMKLMYIY